MYNANDNEMIIIIIIIIIIIGFPVGQNLNSTCSHPKKELLHFEFFYMCY